MRSQLILLPAAMFASAPCFAAAYMTVEQAQASMFPGATFTANFVKLDSRQIGTVMKDSGVSIWTTDIKAWRVSTGGWFIIDQVRGRDDWISYAVAITPEGTVKQIEILECLDGYAGITQPDWLAQFRGKHHGNSFDVELITGATLSSSGVAEGVKRVMSTYALVLKPGSG
jgi:hypothetical protein